MMAQDALKGLKVAILATDGFEQAELQEPRKALAAAGATTTLVSPKAGALRGWQVKDWGDTAQVDLTLDAAKPADYDALLLPGGVPNPGQMLLGGFLSSVITLLYASYFLHIKKIGTPVTRLLFKRFIYRGSFCSVTHCSVLFCTGRETVRIWR